MAPAGWSRWTVQQNGRYRTLRDDEGQSMLLQILKDGTSTYLDPDTKAVVNPRTVATILSQLPEETTSYDPTIPQPTEYETSTTSVASRGSRGSNATYASVPKYGSNQTTQGPALTTAIRPTPGPPVPIARKEAPESAARKQAPTRSMPTAQKDAPRSTPQVLVVGEGRQLDYKLKANKASVASTYFFGARIEFVEFFIPGRLFRVKWAEPRGQQGNEDDEDDRPHVALRPFLVIRQYEAHCVCFPVFSYGRKGVSKTGLTRREIENHAIIYMNGSEPTLLPQEERFRSIMQAPVCIERAPGQTLHPTSRLRVDMPYPVKYNLKVADMGIIRDAAELERLGDRLNNPA